MSTPPKKKTPASDKSPAYLWYPKDAETDEAYRLMTMEQQGIYRALLDHQWLEGSIPADLAQIAMLMPKVPLRRLRRLWPGIVPCFDEPAPGRLMNPRLEWQRNECADFLEAKRTGGLASARARRKRFGTAQPRTDAEQTPEQPPEQVPEQPPNSASTGVEPPAPAPAPKREGLPSARSKHPIFSGQRLTVFEWMLDDCMKVLGPFLERFDLHEWFFQLDAHAVRTALVIPQRDGGAWLQARLLEECQRRGLPIASAQPAIGKQTSRLMAAVANIQASEAAS